MITDKDILGFSGGSNMLSTFSRCDNKSGAVRSRPDILLDARESAVSLKSARPLFNVLNDYYDVMLTFNEAELAATMRKTSKTLRKSLTLQFFA